MASAAGASGVSDGGADGDLTHQKAWILKFLFSGMAEIAMLVAEEYERRVNNSRKLCAGKEEIEIFSYISTLAKNIYESPSFSSSTIKIRLSKIKINQPQSGVCLAASDGAFSA